jgi:hypothetical protein
MMRLAIFSVALLFCTNNAQAEKLSGFAAIEALIGQPIKMKNAKGTSIYTFDSKFEFHMKRAKPFNDEISGRIVQGGGHDKLCFGFSGKAENFCAQVELEDNQLTIIERGAKITTGKLAWAKAKPKDQSTEESNAKYCAFFNAILETSTSGSFDSLKTSSESHVEKMYQWGGEVYDTSLKLGKCVAGEDVFGKFVNCFVPAKSISPLDAFASFDSQASRCLKGKFKFKHSSTDPNLPKSTTDIDQWTSFRISKKAELTIRRGKKTVCDDALQSENCETFSGTWINATTR